MSYRKTYLGFGIFFSLSGILLLTVTMFGESNSLNVAFLSQFSLAILSFCMWKVYPDLIDNDERSRNIKLKTLSGLSIFLVLLILIGYAWETIFTVPFTTAESLNILMFLVVTISSFLLVFFSKKY